jgi:hypothetical protein
MSINHPWHQEFTKNKAISQLIVKLKKIRFFFLLFFQDDYIFGRYLVLLLNLIYISIFFDENNLNFKI